MTVIQLYYLDAGVKVLKFCAVIDIHEFAYSLKTSKALQEIDRNERDKFMISSSRNADYSE